MKYAFVIEAVISMSVDVDAESLEEATEMAHEAPVMSLCWQCSRGEPGEWRTSGELDCIPVESKLVGVYAGDDGEELDVSEVPW